MRIRSHEPNDLPQVQALVALHLSAVVPGWALSAAAIARHLERDDAQPITGLWVEERATVCALEGYRVLALAHLLRSGDRPEVNAHYRGAGSIAWLVARPEAPVSGRGGAGGGPRALRRLGRGPHLRLGHRAARAPLGRADAGPHVADADAAAGAGCFCQRFGWDVLVPETHGWRREPPRAANGTPSGREP